MKKVLIIDDSAYNRHALAGLLGTIPGVAVSTAIDGVDGLKQAVRHSPDLILLDLEMPNMDGFSFLRAFKSNRPAAKIPVVVVSGKSWKPHAAMAIGLGALDYIEKPRDYGKDHSSGLKKELLRKLCSLPDPEASVSALDPTTRLHRRAASEEKKPQIVLIGASTGGPRAISRLISRLPRSFSAAVLVAMHMPQWLTIPFVERISRGSKAVVKILSSGPVERSSVAIVPGGFDVFFRRKGEEVSAVLQKPMSQDPCAPSIDLMFRSASHAWGSRAAGIVLTGMGVDGMEGIISIKEAGGATIAESIETSLMPGMPEAAVSTGKVDKVLGIDEIGNWLADNLADDGIA